MTLLAALWLVASSTNFSTPAPAAGGWYGWQTLLTDAAAVGSGLAYANTRRSESTEGKLLLTLTLSLGELGGPAIHLAHGRPAVALKDLLVRGLAPQGCALLGLLVGTLTTGDIERGASAAGAGFLIGAAGAMIVDALFFARAPAPEEGGPSLSPSLQISPGRASAGLALAF